MTYCMLKKLDDAAENEPKQVPNQKNSEYTTRSASVSSAGKTKNPLGGGGPLQKESMSGECPTSRSTALLQG